MHFTQILPYAGFLVIVGWYAFFSSNSKISIILLFVFSALFIGLRFETGFDWPVYKEEFQILRSVDISLESIMRYSSYFQHEFGYVALVTLSSKILLDYEQFQLLVYILLFVSLLSVSKALKVRSFSDSFFIIVSFLMFTLMMSTMRQCVAIAMINFGVSFFVREKVFKSLFFALLALSFQISSGIYILVFFAASTLKFKGGRLTFIYAALGAVIVSVAVNYIPVFELPIINKLNIYVSREFSSNIYERIFFITINVVALFHSVAMLKRASKKDKFIYRSISIMSAASIALLPITTIRNRIFYENIILYSFVLYNSPYRTNAFKYLISVLGIVSFASSIVKQSRIAFIPYQNYVVFSVTGEQGDGYSRQQQVYAIHREAVQ